MVAIAPSIEQVINIMTLDELDLLRESYSFPHHVQLRIPKEGETITSTRSSEMAFYEAAFPIGLCFPIHPTIRRGTRRPCSEGIPATSRGGKESFSLPREKFGNSQKLGRGEIAVLSPGTHEIQAFPKGFWLSPATGIRQREQGRGCSHLIKQHGGKRSTSLRFLGTRSLELKLGFFEFELQLESYGRIMTLLRAQIKW
ncbi:hypothetical protein Acr_00g0070790 [Actinidia rufa]|uniref:Uncharacterized protein n=1 Tax=Actinidia rufa TaxID=165716 RepID=A0A7J0DRA9_9ERIC|nr:hypothetical protein Acr_00g0070790 [Actinidia rufa]